LNIKMKSKIGNGIKYCLEDRMPKAKVIQAEKIESDLGDIIASLLEEFFFKNHQANFSIRLLRMSILRDWTSSILGKANLDYFEQNTLKTLKFLIKPENHHICKKHNLRNINSVYIYGKITSSTNQGN
jgi:hypothetical protein